MREGFINRYAGDEPEPPNALSVQHYTTHLQTMSEDRLYQKLCLSVHLWDSLFDE
jgi:hypothetical protein